MKTIPEIVEMTADAFGISPTSLVKHDRRKSVVIARNVAIWVATHCARGWGYVAVGRALDGRDQSTIRIAAQKATAQARYNPALKRTMTALLERVDSDPDSASLAPYRVKDICAHCQGEITDKKRTKYCGTRCDKAAERARDRARKRNHWLRKCRVCKTDIKVRFRQMYCSEVCADIANGRSRSQEHETAARNRPKVDRCGQCEGLVQRRPEDGSPCACGGVYADRGFYDRDQAPARVSMLGSAEKWA